MKVHTAVAHALRDSGVDTIFGVIGDANMFYVTDFTESGDGTFIGAVSESGAVSMADGYARVSGRVGVASVTHGPGAANTINALIEAVRAHCPLLLIVGDTPAKRGYPQRIDLGVLFAATGADFHRCVSVAELVDDIAILLARAAATRSPIVLDLPSELLSEEIDYEPSRFIPLGFTRARPDEESLVEALRVVLRARRPLVLAGRGAVDSGAGPVLIELADLLGAPLATTASGKDLFHGHPYNLGIMGGYSTPWARRVIHEADCVVAFGAGLNLFTTDDGELLRGRSVVHCDVEPASIGKFEAVDVALVSDAAAAAADLVQRLRDADVQARSFRVDRLGTGTLDRSPRSEFADCSSADTVDMRTAVIAIEEALPLRKSVVVDTGRFMSVPWRYLHVADPRHFVQTAAWASIGLGTATTVGAAVARPGELTVGVTGDGGGMMGLIEFSTAVRHAVPLLLVVLNDSAYGAEFDKFERAGYDARNSYVEWPEFAEVARALGVTALLCARSNS